MTSAIVPTPERNGDNTPSLALVPPSLNEEDERAARIIARAIELSGLLEKFDDLLAELRAQAPSQTSSHPSERAKKTKLPLITSKCFFVLNKFFFTEYDSYESLLRLTWSREVEKSPIGKLRQRFGIRLQAGIRTVQLVLPKSELHHELPREQQEFYRSLTALLEKEGLSLTDAVQKRREILARVDRAPRPPREPHAPSPREPRNYPLSETQVKILREIILGPEDNVLSEIDRNLGKSIGYAHTARDAALTRLGKAWDNPAEEAKLGETTVRLLGDIRTEFGSALTFEWLNRYCHRFHRGGRIEHVPRPGVLAQATPTPASTSPQTAPVPPTRRAGTDEVIERRVETDADGKTVTRVTLAPSAPPSEPRQKPPPASDERNLHPSQFGLGTTVRIVEALYLGSETYLGDIFPILYRGEIRDRNQALQRWRELFQRVDQPRKRFLALMKAVYRDPNKINEFPPNERPIIRRVLERYKDFGALQAHDQNLNRQRSAQPARPPKPERPFEIAELDREIVRAALAQMGEEKPSLDLVVITRRCRRQLPSETVRQLSQAAFDQLRDARSRQLSEKDLEDETAGLLLNIEMAFFGVNGKAGWSVEEVIEKARSFDTEAKRSSLPIR
jgi:hypothetical protein